MMRNTSSVFDDLISSFVFDDVINLERVLDTLVVESEVNIHGSTLRIIMKTYSFVNLCYSEGNENLFMDIESFASGHDPVVHVFG